VSTVQSALACYATSEDTNVEGLLTDHIVASREARIVWPSVRKVRLMEGWLAMLFILLHSAVAWFQARCVHMEFLKMQCRHVCLVTWKISAYEKFLR